MKLGTVASRPKTLLSGAIMHCGIVLTGALDLAWPLRPNIAETSTSTLFAFESPCAGLIGVIDIGHVILISTLT